MAACVALAVGLTTLVDPGGVKPVAEAFGLWRPQRLLPVVTPAVRSSDYTVLETDYNGDPVTYDPCKPVRYVINPAGAPADYLSFIAPAIAKAQAASGLQFIYDGLSRDSAATRQRPTKVEPVLIAFSGSLGAATADADAVGVGGSTLEVLHGLKQPHYVTGSIQLLSGWFAHASAVHALGMEESVVMHELGHVLGLGHVSDPGEVMYPTAHGQTEYGSGDLAGLARLGSGGCAG